MILGDEPLISEVVLSQRPTGRISIEKEQVSPSYNTTSTFSIIRSKDRKLHWIKSLTSHHLHHRITISSTNNHPRHKSAPQTPKAHWLST
jgi:hypothetical protein